MSQSFGVLLSQKAAVKLILMLLVLVQLNDFDGDFTRCFPLWILNKIRGEHDAKTALTKLRDHLKVGQLEYAGKQLQLAHHRHLFGHRDLLLVHQALLGLSLPFRLVVAVEAMCAQQDIARLVQIVGIVVLVHGHGLVVAGRRLAHERMPPIVGYVLLGPFHLRGRHTSLLQLSIFNNICQICF